jgi:dihydroxyacetone kinase
MRAIRERDELTRLDQAVGDGDLGVNIERGAMAVLFAIDCLEETATTDRLLIEIGKRLNAAGCGSSGTLLSFGILAGARRCGDTVSFLETALAKIQAAGETEPGDKTMVDALFPAVEALRKGGTLEEAAQAAQQGEANTREMLGKKGRALYSSSRSLGTSDPGAHLITILMDEAAHCQRQTNGRENELM